VRERVLPEAPGAPGAPAARVLEIASGTGQHIAHFASTLPRAAATWQPSDVTPELFSSIAAHTRGLPNVAAPIVLDAAWPPERWAEALGLGHGGAAAEEKAAAAQAAGGPSDQHPPPAAAAACGGDALYDAVLAANITHISPWPVTLGLLAGAARVLKTGGCLAIYGPFTLDGRFTTPSNLAFHERLVASDPAWGYRDTRDIAAEAARRGLALDKIEPMPANNFYLLFTKQ
jgi:SAM-dependent methyltransferase